MEPRTQKVEQLATLSPAQHKAAFAIRAPLGAHANKRVEKMTYTDVAFTLYSPTPGRFKKMNTRPYTDVGFLSILTNTKTRRVR